MSRWSIPSRLTPRRPLLILFASIGLIAVAVIDAQRAVVSQQEVATRALREYASFAAWNYGQHLNLALANITREALGAVNHGDNLHTNPTVPRARALAHYLPYDMACLCYRARAGPNPDTFFAFGVGRDSLDVALNAHPDPATGWEVDRPLPIPLPITTPGDYSADDRRWVTDSLTRRIRAATTPDHGYSFIVGREDRATRSPRVIAYTLMPTAWGDTMVYGARYSTESFAAILGGVLDGNGVLPATFTAGRRNRDVLAVRVRDANGNTLFDSAPGLTSPLSAHLDLPERYGALAVDALIRPELAGTLIIGGLPRSRLPVLLGLLLLAASLSVVAVMQLRREGELTRLRADFVSSVSHELRTPLAQIRLYVDTLRLGRATTDAQREWSLGHIERETTRLNHLIENALRFSRLGTDDVVPERLLDVGAEVRKIVDEFQPLALSRRATIETVVTVTTPLALGADALRHMLVNLLDNAVKYGPAGQVICVTVQQSAAELIVSVADQGPGIAESERETIWRPFLRGTTAAGQGGSGIGLTIVREVAAQRGGRAWVEPADAQGARFAFALPLAAAPNRVT